MFLSVAEFFFKITFFMTDVLSVPIWVQVVCKGYWQTTKVAASQSHFACKGNFA